MIDPRTFPGEGDNVMKITKKRRVHMRNAPHLPALAGAPVATPAALAVSYKLQAPSCKPAELPARGSIARVHQPPPRAALRAPRAMPSNPGVSGWCTAERTAALQDCRRGAVSCRVE
jgi:hypothetical protein